MFSLFAGCDHGPVDGGPLFAGVDTRGGGSYADWPAGRFEHVVATFGSYVLCLQHGDRPATLRGVRPLHRSSALFTALLRTVAPQDVAAARLRDRLNYVPPGFGLGRPPDFDEPYAAHIPSPGRYTDVVKGARVTESCAASDSGILAVNRQQVPHGSFTELMITVPSDTGGAEVDGVVIDYTVDGEDYSRTVRWDMVVCDRLKRLPECAVEG